MTVLAFALSMACMYSRVHDAAIRAATRCVELSPSFALGHAALGQALLAAGRAAQALEPLEYGLRRNPYDPRTFIGRAHPGSRAPAVRRKRPRAGGHAAVAILGLQHPHWDALKRDALQHAGFAGGIGI